MQSRIDYKKLGLRIKSIRISKNLTQENLAQLVDCNVSHISNIENNHTKVSLIMLLSIANALNTSIDYLLSEQYENRSLALDNEILRAIKNCDNIKKEKIFTLKDLNNPKYQKLLKNTDITYYQKNDIYKLKKNN